MTADGASPPEGTGANPALVDRLTATRTLASGAVWNVLGRLVPLLIAVLVTPALLREMGIDRWGVFTLALSMIGVFGIFDFGIGRALTRTIAERIGAGDLDEAATAAVTGIAAITGLGVIGGSIIACFVPTLVWNVLAVPPALRQEVEIALWVLCLSAPLVLLWAALWGILSAFQEFRAGNLISMPIAALYYIGPLVLLPLWDHLAVATGVLVFCRFLMTCTCWFLSLRAMPALRRARFSLAQLGPVLRLGGWMTVSNMAAPLLLYLDRFVIASMLSMAATAYYATSYDLITRFWTFPIAVMNAAFPAFATTFRTNPPLATALYRRSMLAILVLVFPAALVVVVWGDELLRLWLGEPFAAHAALTLGLLGLGAVFSCVNFVPTGLLDGIGRPDVNAKLTVWQALIYVPVLLLLVSSFGIEGAAAGWAVRVTLECGLRLFLAGRLYPALRPDQQQVVPLLITTPLLLVAPLLAGGAGRIALCAAAAAILAMILWLTGLTREERRLSLQLLRFRRGVMR